jgi:hypothetical protein
VSNFEKNVLTYFLDPCALDIGSVIKNKEILKILLEANQKLKQHYLDLHKEVGAYYLYKIILHFLVYFQSSRKFTRF